jgi:hypothetical protein
MDRLTGWDKENAYYLKCFGGDEGGCENMCSDECFRCEDNNGACKRLAQYEDTGLSPEEINNLNNFEQSQLAKLLAENGKLKAQNKLMWEALMCLPGAINGTVQGVCRICLKHECQECIIDKAIRDGMGGNVTDEAVNKFVDDFISDGKCDFDE